MRRSIASLVAALGICAIAQVSVAAELPLKAPAAVRAYDWSGFYVGGNLGYGWNRANWTDVDDTTLFGDYAPPGGFNHRLSGWAGGGQLGYNYQSGAWVLGLEAMLDAAAVKGSYASTVGAADDQFEARIDTLLLVTGRVGYAWDQILAYAKGGIAAAHVRASVNDSIGLNTGASSDRAWRIGPTVGLGLEYGVTPNLSVGVEYDYIHLDTGTYQLGDATGSYRWNIGNQNVSLLMMKLNYRFNWLR